MVKIIDLLNDEVIGQVTKSVAYQIIKGDTIILNDIKYMVRDRELTIDNPRNVNITLYVVLL